MKVYLKGKRVQSRFVPARLSTSFVSVFMVLSLLSNTAFGTPCFDLIVPKPTADRSVQNALIQISGLLGARHQSYISPEGRLVHIVVALDSRELGPQSLANVGEIAKAVAIRSINLDPIHPNVEPVEIPENRRSFVRGEMEMAQRSRDEQVEIAKDGLKHGTQFFRKMVLSSLVTISSGVYLLNVPGMSGGLAEVVTTISVLSAAAQIYLGKKMLSLQLTRFGLNKATANYEYAATVAEKSEEELLRSAGFENSHHTIFVVPADFYPSVEDSLSTLGFKDAVYEIDSKTFVPASGQP